MRDIKPSAIIFPKLLVVSPKPLADRLLVELETRFTITSVTNIAQALQFLVTQQPSIVYCSSQFAPTKLIRLLDAVKERSTIQLIPILLGLDFSQATIVIPGTRWAGKLGILTEDMNSAEIQALLVRLLDST